MNYIPAEKLKEKIEKKYLDAKEKARFAGETGTSSDCTKWDAIVLQYENVLRIIDSLQQEQASTHGWVARNKDGCLFLFQDEYPHRLGNEWTSHADRGYIGYKDMIPELTWEDEPIEVELSIHEI